MGERMAMSNRAVAITGATTFLGSELIRTLEDDRRCERVIALDVRKPSFALEKTQYRRLDLTIPAIDGELARILADEEVDTLVHAAFLSQPTHATSWAHELEDIGTMHVVNACANVKLRKLVLTSTTMVYGASAENPNFLTEDHRLKGMARSRFINDKVQAELQVQRYAQEHPDAIVTVLRFAPILGPTASNFFTRFFSRPVAPVMMGYDPLMQFVHERDAVDALMLALERDAPGSFNIVGPGVLPYTTILAMMGKLPVPMPRFVAYPLSRALWAAQIFDTPPNFLDYLRFLCVADGSKAEAQLGFHARYDLKRIIQDFLGVSDDPLDVARATG